MTTPKQLASDLDILEIVANILIKRGYKDADSAARFLGLTPSDKLDVFSIHGVKDAAEAILSAIASGRRIVIYGDYDVDGVTGSSVYYEYLLRHSDLIEYYVPCRIEDGYGINIHSLRRIHEEGVDFVLTVDNGIGGWAVADLALELGVELVITDHHELPAKLPIGIVVNPKIGNQLPEMAGVGVAFLVCSAIERLKPTHGVTDLLDLVAIGTVADLVPLTGVNRPLVRAGLSVASKKERIGLRELIDQNKLVVDNSRSLQVTDISFKLAPCLNAAGRIDRADAGVKLLTATDPKVAYEMAIKLLEINEQRKEITIEVNDKVEKFILDRKVDTTKAVVYYGEGSHHGVLGIAASRVVERYGVPALILGKMIKDGVELYSGSCRAPSGFNLFEAIKVAQDAGLIAGGGGHACAAGVSVYVDKIEEFSKLISDSLFANYDLAKASMGIKLDADVRLSSITDDLLWQLSRFQPTGQGNPEVNLMTQDLMITKITVLKNNFGLKMIVDDGNDSSMECIGFKMADDLAHIKVGQLVDIVYTPEYNYFPPGRPPTIQLRLKKIYY